MDKETILIEGGDVEILDAGDGVVIEIVRVSDGKICQEILIYYSTAELLYRKMRRFYDNKNDLQPPEGGEGVICT